MTIHGFKGFDKDLKCRDMQYEIGKTYETNDKPVICESGFHFCEFPFDVFGYYQPGCSRFCEVDGDGDAASTPEEDTKVAVSRLTIGCEIGLKGMIEAGIKFILNKVEWKKGNSITGTRSGAQATGYSSGAQATGYSSGAQATGTCSGAQATGDSSGAQATGYSSGAQATGYSSGAQATGTCSGAQATGTRSGAQATGDSSGAQATGTCSGAQATGDSSGAQATGTCSGAQATGYRSMACTNGVNSQSSILGDSQNSVAMAIGPNSKAMGTIGSWLVLAEWDEGGTKILHVKTVLVDGIKIKADTFYCLKQGNFVEV